MNDIYNSLDNNFVKIVISLLISFYAIQITHHTKSTKMKKNNNYINKISTLFKKPLFGLLWFVLFLLFYYSKSYYIIFVIGFVYLINIVY